MNLSYTNILKSLAVLTINKNSLNNDESVCQSDQNRQEDQKERQCIFDNITNTFRNIVLNEKGAKKTDNTPTHSGTLIKTPSTPTKYT